MTSSHSTLVVAKNSYLSVAIIIKFNFFLNGDIDVLQLLQKCGHSEGGIVCTENFGAKTRHVIRQVFVELGSLGHVRKGRKPSATVLTLSRSKISSPSFFGAFLNIFKFLKT